MAMDMLWALADQAAALKVPTEREVCCAVCCLLCVGLGFFFLAACFMDGSDHFGIILKYYGLGAMLSFALLVFLSVVCCVVYCVEEKGERESERDRQTGLPQGPGAHSSSQGPSRRQHRYLVSVYQYIHTYIYII